MTRAQLGKELRYSFYIPLHPFKGFWDLKHEKQGSFFTGMCILALTLLVSVFSAYFTEWSFNSIYLPVYNLFTTIFTGLGLFFGWCTSNWCFTCLNDGEGTLKDICTVTAYALVPYLLVQILAIPLSHFLVLREASMYTLLISFGTIWTGFLIVFSTLVVHQYSFTKTLMVCVVTVIGMAVMVYIGLLMLNLLQMIAAFFTTLINELRITLR